MESRFSAGAPAPPDKRGAGVKMVRRVRKAGERVLISALERFPACADGGPRAVVLCYHSIHPRLRLSARPEIFRRHLEWLKDHCTVVPFESVLRAVTSVGPTASPRPIVAITFDDGYADNFDYAYPALVELGLTATFFFTVGLVEGDRAVAMRMQTERRVPEIRGMSWGQLRELLSAGFGVGSHTYDHRNLAALPRPEMVADIERAKAVLEERLESDSQVFAYPYGIPGRHFTRETVEAVRAAGYAAAAAIRFRSVKATDDPLAIPRFFGRDDDVRMLEKKVHGSWDVIGAFQERLPPHLRSHTYQEEYA
jgi:peptidoglycan/xylan/chitin deacetylase (PgdA/CDA1 family)